MNIYMVSAGHLPRMHTAAWLRRIAYTVSPAPTVTVITHYAEQARDIQALMPYANVLYTGHDSLLYSRNVALQMVQPYEWFVGLDDNIQRVTTVHPSIGGTGKLPVAGPPPAGFANWREAYRTETSPLRICRRWLALIDEAKRRDTFYAGFASVENPMFRPKRWSLRRFVKSKMFVMQRVPGVSWGGGDLAHDTWMSAYAVASRGCVVVDNYMHPHHRMYEAGGLGRDRRERGLDELLEQIMAEFPGLVVKARGANSALRFAIVTDTGIARWRAANGYT